MKTTALAAPSSVITPPPPPPVTAAPVAKPPVEKGFQKADSVEIKPKKKDDGFTWGPSTQQVKDGKASLHMGQKGPAVSDVQKKLGLPVTGKFDKNTEVGVALFQKKEGLPTTGAVDAKTLKALEPKGSGAPAGGAADPAAAKGDTGGVSAGAATGAPAPPGKDASAADKYNYAASVLESGKLKPGMSKEADQTINAMINSPGPAIGSDSDTNPTAAARQRFLKAAAEAGYTPLPK